MKRATQEQNAGHISQRSLTVYSQLEQSQGNLLIDNEEAVDPFLGCFDTKTPEILKQIDQRTKKAHEMIVDVNTFTWFLHT